MQLKTTAETHHVIHQFCPQKRENRLMTPPANMFPKCPYIRDMLLNKYAPDDDLICGGAKAALGGAGEAALKQVGTGFHQQQHQQLVLVLVLLRGSRSAVGRQLGSATGFASPARALS